jgi:hypothetical protein
MASMQAHLQIRTLRKSDAAAFLHLCRQLDRETDFMLLEPDERTATVEEQRQRIAEVRHTGNSSVLVAEVVRSWRYMASAQGKPGPS